MKIPLLIEATPEHRFRARGGEPFLVDVEADTPAAALAKARQAIDELVAAGACIAELEVPKVATSSRTYAKIPAWVFRRFT